MLLIEGRGNMTIELGFHVCRVLLLLFRALPVFELVSEEEVEMEESLLRGPLRA